MCVQVPFAKAQFVTPVPALRAGFVQAVDTERVGWAAIALGSGRRVAADKVDHAVGFTQLRKVGHRIAVGDVLAVIHSNRADVADVVHELQVAFTVGDALIEMGPTVVERVH